VTSEDLVVDRDAARVRTGLATALEHHRGDPEVAQEERRRARTRERPGPVQDPSARSARGRAAATRVYSSSCRRRNANALGFLFLLVGVWWMTRAFLERAVNPLWWLGLISGILMSIMAFWTSGQFFIHRDYPLLVFAGIWALMQGITDIVRAFATRRLHEAV
jgi:Short repeat of unknown function (DUF308)